MRDADRLVGWGMASATYGVHSEAAAARVRICADGQIRVASGTHDLGTGTYTTMTQIAADALGVPVERVTAELGDTELPPAPHSGGSQTAASISPAVWLAARDACSKVLALAHADEGAPSHNHGGRGVAADGAGLFLEHDPSTGDFLADILTRHGIEAVEGWGDARPDASGSRFAMRSFGAHFAEVQVDPDLGEVRLTRFCGVFGAGRILNPKTARSQMIGGIVGGVGMALMESTVTDRRRGRVVSPNLSGYMVPTHADVPSIDVSFVDEHDPHVNALGVKGIGEVAIVGVAAAVANAVHHATGRRIRDLPIAPEALL